MRRSTEINFPERFTFSSRSASAVRRIADAWWMLRPIETTVIAPSNPMTILVARMAR
jgi:hypothetical protein